MSYQRRPFSNGLAATRPADRRGSEGGRQPPTETKNITRIYINIFIYLFIHLSLYIYIYMCGCGCVKYIEREEEERGDDDEEEEKKRGKTNGQNRSSTDVI